MINFLVFIIKYIQIKMFFQMYWYKFTKMYRIKIYKKQPLTTRRSENSSISHPIISFTWNNPKTKFLTHVERTEEPLEISELYTKQ